MRVLIIYRFLPHYRAEFYTRLRSALALDGIHLDLIYGRSETDKRDKVDLPWATCIRNRSMKLGSYELLWQPCLSVVHQYDLVIVEQANRLLLNYLLLLVRRRWKFELAFWGHGINRATRPRSLVNRFKAIFVNSVDWWFAYTEGVARYLIGRGYPPHRISVLHNCIDTPRLAQSIEQDTVAVPAFLEGKPVAIYIGGLYREKRIAFLLDCCDSIAAAIPEFQMLVVGAGEDAPLVDSAARTRPWLHALGPLLEKDRLPYLKAAQLTLMPGMVGLVVLDAFAARAPLITIDSPFHGPEISYLVDGENGLVVNQDNFVDTVIALFKDQERLKRLQAGARESAELYPLDRMVESFRRGVVECLDQAGSRPDRSTEGCSVHRGGSSQFPIAHTNR